MSDLDRAHACLKDFYISYLRDGHVPLSVREDARRLIAEALSDRDWGALHKNNYLHGIDCECGGSAVFP